VDRRNDYYFAIFAWVILINRASNASVRYGDKPWWLVNHLFFYMQINFLFHFSLSYRHFRRLNHSWMNHNTRT